MIRIVIDRDEKGKQHGRVVSDALVRHVAEVRIIRLPGLPPKGDLWDWIEAGGTRDQLTQIVANAAVVEVPPAAAGELASRMEASLPENHHNPHYAGDTASSTPRLWSFPYSDSGNAERILARHGQDIRYCHPQKTWYIYDGVAGALNGAGGPPTDANLASSCQIGSAPAAARQLAADTHFGQRTADLDDVSRSDLHVFLLHGSPIP